MSELLIQSASLVFLGLTVLYASLQLRTLRKQHAENHEWNRRVTAQDAIKSYRDVQIYIESLSKHFDYQNRTEGVPAAEFYKVFDEVNHLQSHLHTVLNYFEGLSRGVRQGIYDLEVVENAMQGTLIRVYEGFQYYIDSRRIKLNSPKTYIELEEIASKWKKELRNAPPSRKGIAIES